MKCNQVLRITSIMPFVGFAALALWARRHPHPPLDVRTTRKMQQAKSSLLRSAVLVGNTITGSSVVLNLLVLPVAFLFWKRRLDVEALMTVGISWMSALVRTAIKGIIDRPRPEPGLVQVISRSKGTSFPSGHVSTTVTFWGWLLGWMLLQKQVDPLWKRGTMSFSGLCLLLIGPSRIYLGEHWLTDVVGGYLFGAGSLSLGFQLYLRLRKNRMVG